MTYPTPTRIRRAATSLLSVLLLAPALLLAACSQTPPPPATPAAPNAVLNGGGIVPFGTTVVLDASASSGDDLEFSWSVVSAPTGATPILSSSSASATSFTPTASGTYLLQVEVGNDGGSDSANVTVEVEPIDLAGGWNITLSAGGTPETYPLTLIQSGTTLTGTLIGSSDTYPVTGSIEGDQVTLVLVTPPPTPITFTFNGSSSHDGSSMAGTLSITDGSATVTGSFSAVRAP